MPGAVGASAPMAGGSADGDRPAVFAGVTATIGAGEITAAGV
jgi:hypothetical protein